MKKSKVLLTLMCAVALVVTSVFGTLAYLQDADKVVNTFTVGNVKINLDEKDTEKNDGSRTEVGNDYHLLPGHVYDKDPTVTVLKDSENSYVRMLVTINEQADLDAIFKKINEDRAEKELASIGIIDVLTGWNRAWELTKETENEDNTRTYEFRYNTIVAKAATDTVLPALFTKIEMPGEITNDQLATIADLQIDVVAQAIQADGFENDVDAAWAAF